MLKLKAPLIIAGATCVLSMFIGLISGVRFLNILGRGLIAGIGVGSFVLCARIILERFIPDIFVPPPISSNTVETADISSGSNINITLDDELGVATAVTPGGNTEATEVSNSSEAQAEESSTETFSAATGQGSSDNGNADAVRADSSSPPSFNNSPQGGGNLSDLPNMGSFIDDDENDNNFEETVAADVQTNHGGFSMAGIQTDDTDSKVMAQAIRTVLATED